MSEAATLNAIRAYATRERLAASRAADAAVRVPRAAPAEQRQQAATVCAFSKARANAMDDVLRIIREMEAAP